MASSSAQDEFNELMRDKEHRSTHPEDHDDDEDARSFLNLSDDDEDRNGSSNLTPTASHGDTAPRASLAKSTIPTTRYEANTGPKGVISDAQAFRESQRSRRISLQSSSRTLQQPVPAAAPAVISEKHEDSDGELDEVEDSSFMREWRASRLREMQQNGNSGRESKMHQREKSRRLPIFGSLTTVDGNGYLDAVEKSPVDTVVVVYIYDDYVSLPHSTKSPLPPTDIYGHCLGSPTSPSKSKTASAPSPNGTSTCAS